MMVLEGPSEGTGSLRVMVLEGPSEGTGSVRCNGIRGYSISRTRMAKYVLGIRFFPNYAWAAWSNPKKNCYLVFWV